MTRCLHRRFLIDYKLDILSIRRWHVRSNRKFRAVRVREFPEPHSAIQDAGKLTVITVIEAKLQ